MGENVVNTGEYPGLVRPGGSHIMLRVISDQSRSAGHAWRPINLVSTDRNRTFLVSQSVVSSKVPKSHWDYAGGYPGIAQRESAKLLYNGIE